MADVLVSENIDGTALVGLRKEFDVVLEPHSWRDPDQLRDLIQDVRGWIVRNQTQVTADLVAVAEKLEVIGRAGAGLDNVDVTAASAAGIVVSYTPHENSISVAELTVGLMIALARKIPAAHEDTRDGAWNRRAFTGSEMFGKTLGVIGLGRIGTMVAERARAFGMEIIAHDDFIDSAADHVRELGARLVSLDELLRQADFVSCHVPLTDETCGFMNDDRFGQMKPWSLLINTSRGEVIDEAALVRALEADRIGGVALDVRADEPPEDGPLSDFDNVILTPHIAAFTCEAQERVVAAVCRDVAAVLTGAEATNAYNFSSPRRKGA